MPAFESGLLEAIDALEIAHIHSDDHLFAAEAKRTRAELQRFLAERGGWQPIQTAPRDGTHIDLWITTGDRGRRYADCAWDRERDAWDFGPTAMVSDAHTARPTHWRPIAGPPA